jgi:hypothetical protein
MQGKRGSDMGVRVFLGGALALLLVFGAGTSSALAVSPQIARTTVSAVGSTSATFEAEINPQKKATKYRFEYGIAGPCESKPCASTAEGKVSSGSSLVHVEVPVEELSPGTLYHFRVVADNGETVKGPDRIFGTFSGEPSASLPDGRAYEQATPVDKDGGDAVGEQALTKAAADGEGITFGSTFGIPGGVGAQGLPLYLGSRHGTAGWSTQGLFPPAELGQRAVVEGWLPDFSETFAEATKLGNPLQRAFFALSTTGKAPTMIAPYVNKAGYFFAGTSKDGSTVAFESNAPQPADPVAIKGGAPNVYAWDRASGTLKLASVLNDKASPPKGAFAGPYDWSRGTTAHSLREGGGKSAYYLQDEHAVTASGDVYFTAALTGQLYLRVNPTEEQSPLNGAGKCTVPALACTIQVSATEKTNGKSPDGADPAGPQPAAFQAASVDGSKAFFTSAEKLTNDANTGEEQPLASIGIGPIGGGIEEADFIETHAVGVAVDFKYIYWADPALGTIERAELSKPDSPELFITPGPVKCEVKDSEPPEFVEQESKPRYLAVDAGHIYWTNTGCLDSIERPLDGGGTIGRADIDGAEASVEAEFITGASDPQGIAVNATDVYWANRGEVPAIGRATFEGEGVKDVNQSFAKTRSTAQFPVGVALSPTDVYFTVNVGSAEDEGAFVNRVPLGGGEIKLVDINNPAGKVRGIAVDANNVYWAAQAEEAIGRIPIADFPPLGSCEAVPSCEKDFTSVPGALNGLAADPSHLYWSVNGEAPTNPGNDLYRYEPNLAQPGEPGTLIDLTPVPAGESKNGAEVQGVLGASADGSRVYFAANAVLDDAKAATPGDCHGTVAASSGSCNLYLWEEGGAITFVARLKAVNQESSDSANWEGTPLGVFGSNALYVEKTARLSEDGSTLLFRSTEKLSEFDNEGAPELYRFGLGDPKPISCVSCPPGGEAGEGPRLGSNSFPGMGPVGTIPTTSRNLSADGDKVFFQTAEALLPTDTNAQGGCPFFHTAMRICMDTYEWQAPETGTCKETSPNYNQLSGGCIYLISTGKSKFPSLLADASQSGNDVFFFTRQSLVGQDQDELQDVYDAKVGGGLASQNPPPPNPCPSAEACHGSVPPPPSESSAGSATFAGPGDPAAKHKKQKAKKHKSKKQKKHTKHKQKKQANTKGRASR